MLTEGIPAGCPNRRHGHRHGQTSHRQ